LSADTTLASLVLLQHLFTLQCSMVYATRRADRGSKEGNDLVKTLVELMLCNKNYKDV